MKIRWEITVKRRDTAQSILNRIMKQRKNDISCGRNRKAYLVREFPPFSDMDGEPIQIETMCLAAATVDKLIKLMSRGKTNSFDIICKALSKKVGLPFVRRISAPKGSPKRVKEIEEIRCRLERLEKRTSRDMEKLKLMSPDLDENSICQKMSVSIEILRWASVDGKVRAWKDIASRLYEAKIDAERDRLFHYRRHKKDRTMNKCFDDRVNAAIKTLDWLMIDKVTNKPKREQRFFEKRIPSPLLEHVNPPAEEIFGAIN